MKRVGSLFLLAALITVGTAYAADPELKTDDDKTFYALGYDLSSKLGVFKLTPAELEFLKAGLTDGTLKKTSRVDTATYVPKINALAQARISAGAAEEKKKGKAYLETVAAKKGVKKTGTGLLMETLVEGTGKSPVPKDTVKVNYKGSLIDGKVFDTSEKHGGPQEVTLQVNLMQCWNEALEFMKVGGKAKLYCPSELAYGDKPNGEIPAGATLVFEVELVEIVKR
jgi:FKBP-type peptidyl-prolyl cis-trans isomerase FkpA